MSHGPLVPTACPRRRLPKVMQDALCVLGFDSGYHLAPCVRPRPSPLGHRVVRLLLAPNVTPAAGAAETLLRAVVTCRPDTLLCMPKQAERAYHLPLADDSVLFMRAPNSQNQALRAQLLKAAAPPPRWRAVGHLARATTC